MTTVSANTATTRQRARNMTAVLEAVGICKNYGHVEVLREVDFSVNAGEVTR